MDEIPEEILENREALKEYFHSRGVESGREICNVARELHPDALFIFPLYRSCVVIPKQKANGDLDAILYHDPHWMGEERSVRTLPHYSEILRFHGSRSQVFVSKGGSPLCFFCEEGDVDE